MTNKPPIVLDDILKTAKADQEIVNSYRKIISKGFFSIKDDPASHFCVYFPAYDPINKLIFIGLHKKSGLWLVNGGHMENDENPKQSLKREIKEEWGINMEVGGLTPSLLTITNIESNPAKRLCQTHYDIWFFIPQDSNKFSPDKNKLAEEFYEFGWRTFDEARRLTKDQNTVKGINEIEKII